MIPANSVEKRRGNRRLSFNSYRLNVIVPAKVGAFEPRGSTVILEVVLDDYAEVWVNGHLGNVLGQRGGSVIAGRNAPNKVVLTRDAQPGERIQVAIFGINGPISVHSDTYIWIRSATLDFYKPGKLGRARSVQLEIDRKDAALDAIVPADAKLEKVPEYVPTHFSIERSKRVVGQKRRTPQTDRASPSRPSNPHETRRAPGLSRAANSFSAERTKLRRAGNCCIPGAVKLK